MVDGIERERVIHTSISTKSTQIKEDIHLQSFTCFDNMASQREMEVNQNSSRVQAPDTDFYSPIASMFFNQNWIFEVSSKLYAKCPQRMKIEFL